MFSIIEKDELLKTILNSLNDRPENNREKMTALVRAGKIAEIYIRGDLVGQKTWEEVYNR